jgi:Ca-activated chloride channel homolog
MTRAGKQSKTLMRFVAVMLVLSVWAAHAQSGLNEVYIIPQGDVANPDAAGSLTKTTGNVIRRTVELVSVPVTVTDGANRIVTGLGRENLHLFEDKHPQLIKHVWEEDEPVSLGIVLDISGSMETKIDRATEAVTELVRGSNPEDELFLVTFADRPNLIRDLKQSAEDIQSTLLMQRPGGRRSLLDAIVMAVDNMKNARYRRRAVVIISDGGDNRRRYTPGEVKSLVKEADLLVYSIGVFDSEFRTDEEQLGPELLEEISETTGASAYTLDNPTDLPTITRHISLELRNQYILAYSPDTFQRNGKWRKIKVRLALPRGAPELHVRARAGYYSRVQ